MISVIISKQIYTFISLYNKYLLPMSHRKCHTTDQIVTSRFITYLMTLKIYCELFKYVNINQDNLICNICVPKWKLQNTKNKRMASLLSLVFMKNKYWYKLKYAHRVTKKKKKKLKKKVSQKIIWSEKLHVLAKNSVFPAINHVSYTCKYRHYQPRKL